MARRLTTILAADVVGYSRLMGEDEAGTLATLKSLRRELVKPKELQYDGRTVKLMGDGALMEFASVVDAVAFAVEVQVDMAERNAVVPEERRIVYRMGLNIGDIIVEGDDIYGDGVNVAARLEALSEPGGVCLSRNVFDQVKGKLDLTYEHLGEREVKNIAEPVTVYRVVLDEKAAALVTPIVPAAATTRRNRWHVIAAVSLLGLLGIAGLTWWQPWAPDVEPASVEAMAFPLPEKPSIAVLPFDNLTADPNQDFFVDGLTEDIITNLSKFSDLFVIARNSTFAYKGQPVTVKRVAEDLGVRYVLEGSVQRSADRVRITAQLIDATSGHHLWAERYDRELTDVFTVRDEVTQTIAANLVGETGQLTRVEQERALQKSTNSLGAYDYLLRGWQAGHSDRKQDNERARNYYQKAIELDPNYARAHAFLAWTHVLDLFLAYTEDRAKSLEDARHHASKAIELDDTEPDAHWAMAQVYVQERQHERAVGEYQKALQLNPNYADVLADLGDGFTYSGRFEDSIEVVNRAIRLNPNSPFWYYWILGYAYYGAEQYEAALVAFQHVNDPIPDVRRMLAASLAQLGRTEEAQAEMAQAVEGNPAYSLADFAKAQPFKNKADLDRYLDSLRKAGLTEW